MSRKLWTYRKKTWIERGTTHGLLRLWTPEHLTIWACGLLFNPGAFWVGYHWSVYNRRICINLIPCLTVWVTLPGGNEP